MNFKQEFDRAFSELEGRFPSPDNISFGLAVRERAGALSCETKSKNIRRLYEIDVPAIPEKKHSRLPFVFGAAAVCLIIAGFSFFAGSLSGRIKYSAPLTGSGGENCFIGASTEERKTIEVSELAGMTFMFSDMTAEIEAARFDGIYLRIDYKAVTKESSDISGRTLFVSPLNGTNIYNGITNGGMNEIENIDDKTGRYTVLFEMPMPIGSSKYYEIYHPFYDDEKAAERITDIRLKLTNTEGVGLWNPLRFEDEYFAEDVYLYQAIFSQTVAEISFSYSLYDGQVQMNELERDGIEVCGLDADGNRIRLDNMYSFDTRFNVDGRMIKRYWFYSSDIDALPITQMSAISINGRVFDITELPHVQTTVLEDGRIEAVEHTEIITTTVIPEAASEEATTVMPASDVSDNNEDIGEICVNMDIPLPENNGLRIKMIVIMPERMVFKIEGQEAYFELDVSINMKDGRTLTLERTSDGGQISYILADESEKQAYNVYLESSYIDDNGDDLYIVQSASRRITVIMRDMRLNPGEISSVTVNGANIPVNMAYNDTTEKNEFYLF